MSGLIHIYTGEGKGKTTAAIGLGIRAYGRGFKVLMVQFLKGQKTGELKTIEKLAPDFIIHRGKDIKKFTWQMTEEERREMKREQQELFNFALQAVSKEKWNLVILDEILGAVSNGIINLEDVVKLAEDKADEQELVLTGRNAPSELIEMADYVSEIHSIKHPKGKGIPPRKGIEI